MNVSMPKTCGHRKTSLHVGQQTSEPGVASGLVLLCFPSLPLPLLALFRARHARLPASVRKVLLAFSILGDRMETPEGWNAILKSPSCQ